MFCNFVLNSLLNIVIASSTVKCNHTAVPGGLFKPSQFLNQKKIYRNLFLSIHLVYFLLIKEISLTTAFYPDFQAKISLQRQLKHTLQQRSFD